MDRLIPYIEVQKQKIEKPDEEKVDNDKMQEVDAKIE